MKTRRKVTRREMRAWLAPIRNCFAEMRTGFVDSVQGCPVTRLSDGDDYVRIEYASSGFRALIARLLPHIDCAALELVEKRLAAGDPLIVSEIDAALRLLKRAEDELTGLDRETIKSAVLT